MTSKRLYWTVYLRQQAWTTAVTAVAGNQQCALSCVPKYSLLMQFAGAGFGQQQQQQQQASSSGSSGEGGKNAMVDMMERMLKVGLIPCTPHCNT